MSAPLWMYILQGEAHRRISSALDMASPYHKANHAGLPGLVLKIGRSTMYLASAAED